MNPALQIATALLDGSESAKNFIARHGNLFQQMGFKRAEPTALKRLWIPYEKEYRCKKAKVDLSLTIFPNVTVWTARVYDLTGRLQSTPTHWAPKETNRQMANALEKLFANLTKLESFSPDKIGNAIKKVMDAVCPEVKPRPT